MLYLPRATNALKEVGHPHRKNHRFSQQLFGVFQVSDVIPRARPENSVSRAKERMASVGNSTHAYATYQCTFGLRDTISLSSKSTRSLSYPAPSNFFSSPSPGSAGPFFPLGIENTQSISDFTWSLTLLSSNLLVFGLHASGVFESRSFGFRVGLRAHSGAPVLQTGRIPPRLLYPGAGTL